MKCILRSVFRNFSIIHGAAFLLVVCVQSVFYRKPSKGCRTFFVVFGERVGRSQKMGKLQKAELLSERVNCGKLQKVNGGFVGLGPDG